MDVKHEVAIQPEELTDILGPSHEKERYEGNDVAGVVTGLAWTPAGGDILFIETSIVKGKGKLTLTGNLGDVMKESAVIALQYLKAHAADLDLDPKVFDQYDVHVHVPAGAIPKDGPSAGITMLTALASVFTQREGAEVPRHDGRDHPPRSGPAGRGHQGKAPRRAPGRHQGNRPV